MPSVIITEGAFEGLERCRSFLYEVSPSACERAASEISKAFKHLERFPNSGRTDEVDPSLQELFIPFGGSGYVALYLYEEISDQVLILAFRHQKEAGY